MAKHYLQLSKILTKLLYEKRMNPSDLARAVNLPTPTIYRLVTGKSTRPYRTSLEPIADFFSLSVDQLVGESPLSTEKQSGINSPPAIPSIKQIPLLCWESIDAFLSNEESVTIDDRVIVEANTTERAFAITMHDSSMEPYIPQGAILILDPDKTAKDRSYVLSKINESDTLIFRQILIDGDYQYLKPMNPDLNRFPMRILKKNDEVLATLIEIRHRYVDL